LCQVSSGDLVISAYIKLRHVKTRNSRLRLDMNFYYRLGNVIPGWKSLCHDRLF